jgi:hypothetical protein
MWLRVAFSFCFQPLFKLLPIPHEIPKCFYLLCFQFNFIKKPGNNDRCSYSCEQEGRYNTDPVNYPPTASRWVGFVIVFVPLLFFWLFRLRHWHTRFHLSHFVFNLRVNNYFNFTSSLVNHLWSFIFMPSFMVMSEILAGSE